MLEHTAPIADYLQSLDTPEPLRTELQAHWNAIMGRLDHAIQEEVRAKLALQNAEEVASYYRAEHQHLKSAFSKKVEENAGLYRRRWTAVLLEELANSELAYSLKRVRWWWWRVRHGSGDQDDDDA